MSQFMDGKHRAQSRTYSKKVTHRQYPPINTVDSLTLISGAPRGLRIANNNP